jgi:hypothetical protein
MLKTCKSKIISDGQKGQLETIVEDTNVTDANEGELGEVEMPLGWCNFIYKYNK